MALSRGELKVREILENNGLDFVQEYSPENLFSSGKRPLRFDFAIFDDDGNIDFYIEYQGEQHYLAVKRFGGANGLKKQKYNDLKKREYCQKNNIPLLAIPYWDYDVLDYDYIMIKVSDMRG